MGVLAGSWPRVECIGGRRGNPEQRESVAAMTANGTTANGGQEGEKVAPPPEKGSWTIGLINSRFKYLSAETFGFKINANGKAMKKKQVWILEPYGDGDSICLRSHMHKFLAVDQFGNVTCENEEKDDTAKFEISVCDDFSGRWAFRSVTRGYFLGASADNLVCSAKSPGDGELWYVNLAARPQVNLRSVGRRTCPGAATPSSPSSSGRRRTSSRFTRATTSI